MRTSLTRTLAGVVFAAAMVLALAGPASAAPAHPRVHTTLSIVQSRNVIKAGHKDVISGRLVADRYGLATSSSTSTAGSASGFRCGSGSPARRAGSRHRLLSVAAAPVVKAAGVEDEVLDGMSTRQAVAVVAGLSPDQAEVVALRIIAGLDTAAVANLLGKSPGAVRIALHRGLRALSADPRVRALEEVDQ